MELLVEWSGGKLDGHPLKVGKEGGEPMLYFELPLVIRQRTL